MNKIKTRIQKFIIGRYGIDKLSNYLLYGGLAVVVLFNLLNWEIVGLLDNLSKNWTTRGINFTNEQFISTTLIPTVKKNYVIYVIKEKLTSPVQTVTSVSSRKRNLAFF